MDEGEVAAGEAEAAPEEEAPGWEVKPVFNKQDER